MITNIYNNDLLIQIAHSRIYKYFYLQHKFINLILHRVDSYTIFIEFVKLTDADSSNQIDTIKSILLSKQIEDFKENVWIELKTKIKTIYKIRSTSSPNYISRKII